MTLTKDQISQIANEVGLDYARLMAFVSVESGGVGFNTDGKIIIQFEPTWFAKFLTKHNIAHAFSQAVDPQGNRVYTIKVGSKTITNGVQGQKSEWEAFDIAFSIDPQAAMLSTSIGAMQIMGFNFSSMGYKTVDEMWDDFKKGEYQQILGGAKFIKSNTALYNALRNKDWAKVAYYYNGEKYSINHYDTHLQAAYQKYSS